MHRSEVELKRVLGNSITRLPESMKAKCPEGLGKNAELNFYITNGFDVSAKSSKYEVVRAMYYKENPKDYDYLKDSHSTVRGVSINRSNVTSKSKFDEDWFVRYCYYKANRIDRDWILDNSVDVRDLMKIVESNDKPIAS